MKHKIFILLAISLIILVSCETAGNVFYADRNFLSFQEIFALRFFENSARPAKTDIKPEAIYIQLADFTEKYNIEFYLFISEDNEIQDIYNYLTIIHAGDILSEKLLNPSLNYFENPANSKEDLLAVLAGTEIILNESIKRIIPASEKIDLLVYELKWDEDHEEGDLSEHFFDILELENQIANLRSLRKILTARLLIISNKISEILNQQE